MHTYIRTYIDIHACIHTYNYKFAQFTKPFQSCKSKQLRGTHHPHVMTCQGHGKEGLGEEGPFDVEFDSPQSTNVQSV